METIYYIGLDVHKKSIAYCIKTVGGKTIRQGVVGGTQRIATMAGGPARSLDGGNGGNALHRLDL